MSITGFLQLGTAVSGGLVVPPSSGAGYAPQAINFDEFPGGVTLNGAGCIFGPLTASWGTLTVFGIVDASGNAVVAPGTLQTPFTPSIGQLVTVPQGSITLVVGSQFTAAPGSVTTGKAPPLTYSPIVSGTVGTTSNVLVPSGTFTTTFTIQTQPGSTGNIWMRPDGSVAVSGAGPYVFAGGGSYTFGTAAVPLPTADLTAVTDAGVAQKVSISGG